MSLINNQEPYRVKSLFVKLPHTHSLDHGDDIVFFNIKHVTLNATYRRTRTKLFNLFNPLIRKKLLVYDNHCTDFQLCRKSQGDGRFPESTRER